MVDSGQFLRSLLHSDVNPLNDKSRSLPLLNVVDRYGRTFHLSWLGFFVAFLAWFAFPPLIHSHIQEDLNLTQAEIANSNLIAVLATLLVRLIVGPLCDRYGPRYVMVGCLVAGAIPTALTPFIRNASGLTAIRFFVGILGGTFVPCQVWISQFFDKNIIGSVTALVAGWGNAGGGVTFFLMPAIVARLEHVHGFNSHWAWRVAFPVCPLLIIISVAMAILVFGHDTPTGSWRSRHSHATLDDTRIETTYAVSSECKAKNAQCASRPQCLVPITAAEKATEATEVRIVDNEDGTPASPTALNVLRVVFSSQTLLVALPYLCSFGSELAVEGIIANFYVQTARQRDGQIWNSQTAGNWAAIFGLLNFVTRPWGGYISDMLYQLEGLVAKKYWLIFVGVMQSVFLLWIGLVQLDIYLLISAMTGLAIFMEAANGAIFSLVPAIHPKFGGVVAGVTGASGNLGGVLFCLVFRFLGTDYHAAFWIIGFFCLGCNLAVMAIPLT